MFDLNAPSYVWISGIMLLFIKEIRYWFETILNYEIEYEEKEKEKELPESVKRMFS